jgi:preprotein translocase SecE subunit
MEPRRLLAIRGVDAIVGVAVTLASIWLIFYAIPWFWDNVLHFVTSGDRANFVGIGLLLAVMVLVAGGLGFVGLRFMGPRPRQGLRAGIVVGSILVFLAALLTSGIGQILERAFGSNTAAAGAIVTVVIFLVLVAAIALALTRPGFDSWMVMLDEQGWFTSAPYKRTQGQKVRRGTILGVLILAACGVYSLNARWAAGPTTAAASVWDVYVPFTGGHHVVVLSALRATLPILLGLLSFWFAYRVVNLPVFADFLIATEAEMNKVSWTTRQRLVQDTIVVLVTVVLLTIFLFLVDVVWSKALRAIDIIHTAPATEREQEPRW